MPQYAKSSYPNHAPEIAHSPLFYRWPFFATQGSRSDPPEALCVAFFAVAHFRGSAEQKPQRPPFPRPRKFIISEEWYCTDGYANVRIFAQRQKSVYAPLESGPNEASQGSKKCIRIFVQRRSVSICVCRMPQQPPSLSRAGQRKLLSGPKRGESLYGLIFRHLLPKKGGEHATSKTPKYVERARPGILLPRRTQTEQLKWS